MNQTASNYNCLRFDELEPDEQAAILRWRYFYVGEPTEEEMAKIKTILRKDWFFSPDGSYGFYQFTPYWIVSADSKQ